MADGPVHAGSRMQLLGPAPTAEQIVRYSPDQGVPDRAPPTILVHAADDGAVPVANTLMMFTALRAKAIPTEMHVFELGGHGFGLRSIAGLTTAAWPALVEAFARKHGV